MNLMSFNIVFSKENHKPYLINIDNVLFTFRIKNKQPDYTKFLYEAFKNCCNDYDIFKYRKDDIYFQFKTGSSIEIRNKCHISILIYENDYNTLKYVIDFINRYCDDSSAICVRNCESIKNYLKEKIETDIMWL